MSTSKGHSKWSQKSIILINSYAYTSMNEVGYCSGRIWSAFELEYMCDDTHTHVVNVTIGRTHFTLNSRHHHRENERERAEESI